MQTFKNILFIADINDEDQEALKQVLMLTLKNNALLKILVLAPELPKDLASVQHNFDEYFKSKIDQSIKDICSQLNLNFSALKIQIIFENAEVPVIRIIQHVLRDSHDLVVKNAQGANNTKIGFTSINMALLRMCPCPVFLCRPARESKTVLHIAVAVDVENSKPVEHDLSIQLLQSAHDLALAYDAKLSILSCWAYEYEEDLTNSIWCKIPKNEVRKIVDEIESTHKVKLAELIASSNIGNNYKVYSIKGTPDKEIPIFVDKQAVDILVMGTVARTGISGFIMGNTAENILQQISCSSFTRKPNGFVSPVEAY